MDMDTPLVPDETAAPEKIKLVCRYDRDGYRVYFSAKGREWELPETPEEQLALRLLDAHAPQDRLREVAKASEDGCAVLVFRTDTLQMEEFSRLLDEGGIPTDDPARPED